MVAESVLLNEQSLSRGFPFRPNDLTPSEEWACGAKRRQAIDSMAMESPKARSAPAAGMRRPIRLATLRQSKLT